MTARTRERQPLDRAGAPNQSLLHDTYTANGTRNRGTWVPLWVPVVPLEERRRQLEVAGLCPVDSIDPLCEWLLR